MIELYMIEIKNSVRSLYQAMKNSFSENGSKHHFATCKRSQTLMVNATDKLRTKSYQSEWNGLKMVVH